MISKNREYMQSDKLQEITQIVLSQHDIFKHMLKLSGNV